MQLYLIRSSFLELVLFAKIGAIGFVIDGGVLMILYHHFQFDHYESRAVSFSLAVGVTWVLNRIYTFRKYANENKLKEYFSYFIVQMIGAFVNLFIYVLLINASMLMANYPIIPLSVGAGVALIFNYIAVRSWVFKAGGVK